MTTRETDLFERRDIASESQIETVEHQIIRVTSEIMPWISEDMDISTVLVKLPTGQTVRYGSAMTQQAKKIMDIESGTLQAWCRGLKPSEIEMAINFLVKQNIIASYDLPDPKDKKSKYTFYTLAINKDSLWGTKQFKTKK